MAEIWGAAIAAAGAVGGAAMASNGAKRAANAQARGADAAAAEAGRQFDLIREDNANNIELGQGASALLARLYGIPLKTPGERRAGEDVLLGDTWLPAGTTAASPGNKRGSDILFNGRVIGRVNPGGANGRFVPSAGVDINQLWGENEQAQGGGNQLGTPDLSAFFESPDYQSRLERGTRGIERTAAARGGAFSGNALRGLTEYNSDLASTEFNNNFNRLAAMAGIGQAATNASASAGMASAGIRGNALMDAGNARASGIVGQGNAIAGGIADLAGLYGYYSGNRRPVSYGGTGYGGYPMTTPGYGDVFHGSRYA